MRWMILLFMLTGCITFPKVRPEDLEAWRGAPLIDLESHPLFSSLPLEKRSLSNGDELWIYKNLVGSAVNCQEGAFGVNCQEGAKVRGCMNQFIVSGGVVKEYRPVAIHIISCFTDCRTRPASRPCQ